MLSSSALGSFVGKKGVISSEIAKKLGLECAHDTSCVLCNEKERTISSFEHFLFTFVSVCLLGPSEELVLSELLQLQAQKFNLRVKLIFVFVA